MWRWRSDWFADLMGYEEEDYADAKSKMEALDDPNTPGCKLLRSKVTGKTFGAGQFELISLNSLRERVAASGGVPGKLRVSVIQREAREMHREPEFANSLIQVASQFNVLEMVSYSVSPEHGVTGYAGDATQGPACAIACGAGTIYRNYLVPIGDQIGQTRSRQLDGLADVGKLLSAKLDRPLSDLWSMRNGYAMCRESGLGYITEFLARCTEEERDELRRALAIGIHSHVQVTDVTNFDPPIYTSQAYCSALPVSYCGHGKGAFAAFATLVLESLYESTLLQGVLNAKRWGSNIVLLTCVGGGVFGNQREWIETAMRRAFRICAEQDLDVRIVSYGRPDGWLVDMCSKVTAELNRAPTKEQEGEGGSQ